MKAYIPDPPTTSDPVCLDFANTLHWHASDSPEETLHSYPDLVTWAQAAGLLTEKERDRLTAAAEANPGQGKQVLVRARALREILYRIFAALAAGDPPVEADLAALNQTLPRAMSGAQILRSSDGFQWAWEMEQDALDGMLDPILRSAAYLLTSKLRSRIGQCADDRGCGWLFIDTSKNRSRRWCSMQDCGNRAKQRRYYRRKDK
jgi:predicted RNA-binding Zn ribbon-like protein